MPEFTVPDLQAGQVHIWQMPIAIYQTKLPYFRGILSDDEQQRANRYIRPRHGRNFTLTRGYLRVLLAQYINLSPHLIQFDYNEQGKLAIEKNVHFNISHSHEQVIMAFSRDFEIGIDIEYHDPNIEHDMLAERFFAPAEVRQIKQYQGDMRRQAFFKCWTSKEAYVKVCGAGLTMPLKAFAVDANPQHPAKLLSVHDDSTAIKTYWLQSLITIPDYTATLAIKSQTFSLKYCTLPLDIS